MQAEADARAARTRLAGSLAAAQDRLRPATLVREARRELAVAGLSARRVVDDRSQRLAIGGSLAGLLVIGFPLLRWRRSRRIAARAARIRGD